MTEPPAPDEISEISTAMAVRRLTNLAAEKEHARKRRDAAAVRRVIAMLTPPGDGNAAPSVAGRRTGRAPAR